MEFQELNFYILIIFAVYLGILTTHLIIRASKSETRRKNYYFSIAIFSGFYLLCRIMLTINFLLMNDPHSIIYIWATFFVLIGFAGLMFSVEKFIFTKLKFIPTLFILIFASLVLIFPEYNGTNMVTYWAIAGGAFGILIPFLYLYVGYKSAGEIRKISYIIAIGTLIFIIGKTMNTVMFQEEILILWVLAPILMIIGLMIFHYGIMKQVT